MSLVSLDDQVMAISRQIDELQAEGKLTAPDHSRLQVALIRLRTDIEEQRTRHGYDDDMEYCT